MECGDLSPLLDCGMRALSKNPKAATSRRTPYPKCASLGRGWRRRRGSRRQRFGELRLLAGGLVRVNDLARRRLVELLDRLLEGLVRLLRRRGREVLDRRIDRLLVRPVVK